MNFQHKEAFCLMKYKCACGHTEVIWNSRDGVTPFILRCPKCSGELTHVAWHEDTCAPDYIPEKGQLVFIDLPISLRRPLALLQITHFDGTDYELSGGDRELAIKSIIDDMGNGDPFLIRWL